MGEMMDLVRRRLVFFFSLALPGVVNVHNCVQVKRKKRRHHKHHTYSEDEDSSSGSSMLQCRD